MRTTKRSQAGFTLIEMLVAISVTSLLLMVFMSFSANSLVQTSLTSARGDLLREAQLTLDAISRDIRLSSNADDLNRIPDENSPGGAADPFSWISDDSTIILATAAMDASGDIIFEDALRYSSLKNNSIYFVRDRTLYKRTLAAESIENAARTTCPKALETPDCPSDRELISGNVEQFSVRYLNADDSEVTTHTEARSIELSLVLKTSRYGRVIETSYVTRTVFRNE